MKQERSEFEARSLIGTPLDLFLELQKIRDGYNIKIISILVESHSEVELSLELQRR